MPTVRFRSGKAVRVESGTPLDVAIRKAGLWGIYRSVKYGRLRDIMDSSHIYPQYSCVEVEGHGLVNPLSFRVKQDVSVVLHTDASLGSALSGKVPLFGVGFQNMWPIRGGPGWRLARKLILSSANLPTHTLAQPAPAVQVKNVRTCVLVVGAGPAGIGVASALHEKGVEFLVVDQHESLGGRLRHTRHLSSLRGVVATGLWDQAEKLAPHTLQGSFLGLYEEGVGLVAAEDSVVRIEFQSLVYATGSRPPPPLFGGNDTPGVVSVDYALRLDQYGLLERPIVFYVEDEWGKRVCGALEKKTEIILVSPLQLEGKAASRIVRVKREANGLLVLLDNNTKTQAKLVVYSTTRQPSLELPAQAGFTYRPLADRVVCQEYLENRLAQKGNVWVAGSATGLYELADAYNHGRALGLFLAGESGLAEKLLPQPATPQPSDSHTQAQPEAFLCFCEDVRVGEFLRMGRSVGAEKAKRLTGWGTGVCQGKLCVANGLRLLGEPPYTQRLPVQPTPLFLLAALGDQLGPQKL